MGASSWNSKNENRSRVHKNERKTTESRVKPMPTQNSYSLPLWLLNKGDNMNICMEREKGERACYDERGRGTVTEREKQRGRENQREKERERNKERKTREPAIAAAHSSSPDVGTRTTLVAQETSTAQDP